MASFVTNGIEGLSLSLSEIADIPDKVVDDMLSAGAKIVADAQKNEGRKQGVHRTGVTLSSIKAGKPKRAKDGGRCIYVTPQGTNRDGVRNAEVAFVNEYGAPQRGISPRPFMRTANEAAEDQVAETQAKIYDNYLKTKNL